MISGGRQTLKPLASGKYSDTKTHRWTCAPANAPPWPNQIVLLPPTPVAGSSSGISGRRRRKIAVQRLIMTPIVIFNKAITDGFRALAALDPVEVMPVKVQLVVVDDATNLSFQIGGGFWDAICSRISLSWVGKTNQGAA